MAKFKQESNVPKKLTESHIGCKVIFRIPGQVVINEGVIEEFTKEKEYMKIGKRWISNRNHTVLSILSKPQKPKRRAVYE